MTSSEPCILVLDQGSLPGPEIWCSVRKASATVHVVNSVQAALTMTRSKRLTGAIIDRDCLDAVALCAELTKINVPYLFHGPTSGDIFEVLVTLLGVEPPSSSATRTIAGATDETFHVH